MVKLIKGHFTHFKRGCFFMTTPFKSVVFCFSPRLITAGAGFPSSPWDAARLLFRFLLNPSKRLLLRVPFLRVPKKKKTDVADSVRGSLRDYQWVTEMAPGGCWGGQTGWERRLLGWYFRSCWDWDQPSVADGYLDPTVDDRRVTRFKFSTCSRASQSGQ